MILSGVRATLLPTVLDRAQLSKQGKRKRSAPPAENKKKKQSNNTVKADDEEGNDSEQPPVPKKTATNPTPMDVAQP